MTTSPGWRAFIDESMPHPRPGTEPTYIIAAAILDERDCSEARWLVSALSGKRPRFHWKERDAVQRLRAVEAIAELPALHILAVGAPMDPHRQERARSKALQCMLYELQWRGVRSVNLESRTARLNERDLRTVDAAKIRGLVDTRTDVTHELPQNEPLLWIPDIVAGAMGGIDAECHAVIGELVEIVRVPID